MGDRRRPLALPFAFTVLVAPNCGVQDGQANQQLLTAAAGGPDTGSIVVAFAPTAATFRAEQASLLTGPTRTAYDVLIDGEMAVLDDGDGHTSALTVTEGSMSLRGYLDAGPHHFTIRASGAAPAFDGDGAIPGGGAARLFLFGPVEALQGRFVSTPDTPAFGNEHVTAVNLMENGQTAEVVSCMDGSCTPLSDPLGLGDVFDTEIPATDSDPLTSSLTDAGTGVGYRVVPTAALPAPPVLAFQTEVPEVFVAAPVYLSDQGLLLYGFN